MKKFILWVWGALAATATFAAPEGRAIDWDAAKEKVGEIGHAVTTAYFDIKYHADEGTSNVTVWESINGKATDAFWQCYYLLGNETEAVRNRSLTATQVMWYNGELTMAWVKARYNLSNDLEVLNKTAAEYIVEDFAILFDQLDRYGNQLFSLVYEKPTKVNAIDWDAVKEKLVEIEIRVKAAVWDILYATESGDEDSDQFLMIYQKLVTTFEEAGQVLYSIKHPAESKTLNSTQTKTFNGDLKDVLGNLLGGMADNLENNDLLPGNKIRDTFTSLFRDVNHLVADLTALVSIIA